SELQLRVILEGFGKRFRKYVLNLNGHGHVYERSKPEAHVVHITAGTGGGALEHADTPCLWTDCKAPPFTAFRAIHHGFLKIAVERDRLRVEVVCAAATPGGDDMRCAEGQILDHGLVAAG